MGKEREMVLKRVMKNDECPKHKDDVFSKWIDGVEKILNTKNEEWESVIKKAKNEWEKNMAKSKKELKRETLEARIKAAEAVLDNIREELAGLNLEDTLINYRDLINDGNICAEGILWFIDTYKLDTVKLGRIIEDLEKDHKNDSWIREAKRIAKCSDPF